MEQQELKKLQKVLLDIMIDVDRFCRENGLRYSLFAGTALGAVRHQGFIPWDDDVDLAMSRREFERFKRLWKERGLPGYYLQDPDSESSHIEHIKIRKNGTILASKKEYEKEPHNGIWVDIFAVDKVPQRGLKKQIYMLMVVLNLVYTRGYPYERGGKVLKLLSKLMLALPRKLHYKIKRWTADYIKSTADWETGFDWRLMATPLSLKWLYPPEMFSEFVDIPFENHVFPIVSCYEGMLEAEYGDYMQLPPEEERVCRHNPEIIDFGE